MSEQVPTTVQPADGSIDDGFESWPLDDDRHLSEPFQRAINLLKLPRPAPEPHPVA